MALTKCPECNHEISDKAEACPNCGWVLDQDLKNPVETTRNKTEMGEIRKRKGLGIFYIIMGVLFIAAGILTLFFIIGIIPLFLGLVLFVFGINCLRGERQTTCPYCGAQRYLFVSNPKLKCQTCKKISVVQGEYLKRTD